MKKIDLACLIEDDPIHAFLSKKYLDMSGMIENLLILSNGQEAFEKLKALLYSGEKLPELILLDINMPVWDGWQFLDEFLKLPVQSKITIYILSSSIHEEDRRRAREYNKISDFIVKPITLDTLIPLLKSVS
ncbi:response regulator receiver domain-containing protein [Christiangramia gaetbulicola]|uniref:Response regulator receiver domain-containing protein n=1 Tax=Christiangramia gaetbulicola TaxID=703340 RepID=A0A2T6AID1_9FLAO|nr:response regulator [Christiangramia gaetbulicola]PTX43566.1 response regulator receiver domain-containing protein [Christiangramia gaetbulicola]